MQSGRIIGCAMNPLYGSETKYGYDGGIRHRFDFVIDGERYKAGEVLARAVAAGLQPSTVYTRLHSHATHTWEELLRPADGSLKNEEAKAAAAAKRKKTMRRKSAYAQMQREKRAYYARKKAGHADIS